MAATKKQTFTLSRQVEFEVPCVPNFVRPVDGSAAVPVSDLSADEITNMGRAWIEAVRANATRQCRVK